MKTWGMLLLGLILVIGVGCSSSRSTSTAQQPEPTAPEKAKLPIPPNSPFAKIKIDMGNREVEDLIGRPTDVETYATGKAYNPFYFGTDHVNTTAHYKGIGRIIYNSDGRVAEIEYDPSERGYR